MYKNFFRFILFTFLVLVLCACSHPVQVSSERFCFGTLCKITLYGKVKNPDKIFNEVWDRMNELENNISCKLPESNISKLNNGYDVKLDEDSALLVETGNVFMNLTEGAFSPYLCALSELWGIGTENARVPQNEEIAEALKQKKTDLGALGKGYASDVTREILIANEVESAIINFGGNICCIGSKPDGKAFVIGLQSPDAERGVYDRTVEACDCCVVTSGDYERFFVKDGVRYCHIFNGLTGYPVDNGTRAVTVMGNSGLICDALSTCCFILGEECSSSVLAHYPDYKVIFSK